MITSSSTISFASSFFAAAASAALKTTYTHIILDRKRVSHRTGYWWTFSSMGTEIRFLSVITHFFGLANLDRALTQIKTRMWNETAIVVTFPRNKIPGLRNEHTRD
jgi:hypothetical protein